MFCPKCGSLNPDDAKFCGNCSAPLAANPAPDPAPDIKEVIETNNYENENEISPGIKYGVGVAALLVPLIGLIMGFMYLAQGETQSKKDTGKFWLIVSAVGIFIYLAVSGDL